MSKFLIAVAIVGLAFVAYLVFLGGVSRSGSAAGLLDGKLRPCPGKPNCVCSENSNNTGHYTSPLSLEPDFSDEHLIDILRQEGGRIETRQPDYIAASFASALFGFVDDFEVRIDREAGLLHFRLASRVGRSDLGANRKRVDAIKHRLGEKTDG